MKNETINFLSFLVCIILLNPVQTQAANISAIASGDWDESTTWSGGNIPGAGDDVTINGFVVTIDDGTGDVNVQSIQLLNNANSGNTKLSIIENVTLSVSMGIYAHAESYNYEVELELKNTAILEVTNDITFERNSNFSKKAGIELHNSSQVNIGSNLNFTYTNSGFLEISAEVALYNSAILDIGGSFNITQTGGNAFEFFSLSEAQLSVGTNLTAQLSGGNYQSFQTFGNSQMQVAGDVNLTNSGSTYSLNFGARTDSSTIVIDNNLNLNSTVDLKKVTVSTNGDGASLSVKGDINMTAQGDSSLYLKIENGSQVNLAGDVNRLPSNNFGVLEMDDDATFNFNGTAQQSIPAATFTGSGLDSFNITNLIFNNTSGDPFIMEGPITIQDHLELTSGVITTTATNIIILADQATISGGSTTSFINGPIRKLGSTNGVPLLFPTGFGKFYAPIEISGTTNANNSFTAQYFRCPPPLELDVNGFEHVIESGYWRLDRTAGTDDQVDLTLHWDSADEAGVDDLASLIVVSSNADNLDGWFPMGNGGTSGAGLGSLAGSITNDAACPPPLEIELFALGSTDPSTNKSLLPIEMLEFTATKKGQRVQIDWTTTAEVNNDRFVIEKSADGRNFHDFAVIPAKGNENAAGINYYTTDDRSPISGVNYYRVKQIDYDGSMEFSYLLAVNFQTEEKPVIYPNPVRDVVQIRCGNDDEDTFVEVFDQQGKLVYTGTCNMSEGMMQLSTNQLNLQSNGTYFMKISNEAGSSILKFVKSE